ncbi:MAG: hypothetical protein IPN34_12545 [Planctomycetes bacterium]|nr:hypothetical protein [Planctomycetota bacterium]
MPALLPLLSAIDDPGRFGDLRASIEHQRARVRAARRPRELVLGAPARDGGAVDLWEGSELWISPTPTSSIFADAGTTARCFGAPPASLGTGNFISEARALPELEVGMLGPGFRAVSSFAISGAPVFLGISLASGFAPLDPFGHLGVLEMDYDRALSALIAVGSFDGAGRYEAWLPVPPWAFSALAHQALRFQLLSLDGTGRIAVSGVDLLVLPAYG